MATELLWKAAKPIIDSIREIIKKDQTLRTHDDPVKYQIVSESLIREKHKLETIFKEHGLRIRQSVILHFKHSAVEVEIPNDTRRLFLFPLGGSSILRESSKATGGEVTEKEPYWEIRDDRALVLSDKNGIDCLFVIIEKN